MAGRILNRRELRKQADEAEARESQETREGDDEDVEEADAEEDEDAVEGGAAAEEGDDEEVVKPAKKKAKAKAPPKPRKPRKPKAAPRMRARWGVFDASMKQVAIFDYNQRVEAEQKAPTSSPRRTAPSSSKWSRSRWPSRPTPGRWSRPRSEPPVCCRPRRARGTASHRSQGARRHHLSPRGGGKSPPP